jgi:glycosyltransferase involved in cell wall biosynthesis
MACGCFPVAGDLESLREWIDPGINGFLVDPADPSDIAAAIVEALERTESREQALIHNQKLIKTRAEYNSSMASALNFYQTLIKN